MDVTIRIWMSKYTALWYSISNHSMQPIWAHCHYPANLLGMSEPLKPNSSAPWSVCFKGLHLPIFWSRCKAILEFPEEAYANHWLNWTVGSDFLLPEYWNLNMIWLIFPCQFNSFSFYSFRSFVQTIPCYYLVQCFSNVRNESMVTVKIKW